MYADGRRGVFVEKRQGRVVLDVAPHLPERRETGAQAASTALLQLAASFALNDPCTSIRSIAPLIVTGHLARSRPIHLERIDGRIHGLMREAPLRLLEPLDDVGPLANALGLHPTAILVEPKVRPADTGAAHLMVRVRDAATVDDARPDADRLLSVLKTTGAEGCYLFALPDAHSPKAYARFFNPTVGLWEDAATGTAAGPLAADLAQAGIVRGDQLVVEQGTQMGRRSLLRVQLTPNPELSGTGIVVLQGLLRL